MATEPPWNEHLSALRDLMKNATDLAEPVNYFLDHLAEDRAFMQQSTWDAPRLDTVLAATAEKLLGPGTVVQLAIFQRSGELAHGTCMFGVLPATVLYDSGINVGIVAVPTGGKTELMRFRVIATPVRGEGTP